jgi:UPF0271 protein
MRAFQGRLLTTRQILEELKDPRAQAALEILGVEVVDVDERRAEGLAKKAPGLSKADLSALALALETGCTLLTDDVALAKAARKLGVKVKGFYFVK